MSFYEVCQSYRDFDFNNFLESVKDEDILRILNKSKLTQFDFLTLLSPAAEKYLEEMAQKARQLSLQHFGKAVILFTPMYIANYCVNKCAYCGYNAENKIVRKKLTMEEIRAEAQKIAETGLKHILVLTGESRKKSPPSYIIQAIEILKEYFQSISIEVYPLTAEEYREMVSAGVDGLTIYQEAYDEQVYDRVHLAGPKKNYRYRLEAPERACQAKIRSVCIGALLGLADWRKEAFFTGLHAAFLQDNYPDVEMSVSFPRIRPHQGAFEDVYPVSDKNLVQVMLATRLYLPFVGTTMSTRERSQLRDNLVPLGINKISAGVSTEVGGHAAQEKGEGQFEIADNRSVAEMREALLAQGYQAVFKNWLQF